MSVTFSSTRPRGKGDVTQQTIQKMLDENHYLIQCIMDYQSKGKTAECTQYQQILHRNLVYLATIADSNQNMQSLLPAPPNPGMSVSGGGMGGSSAGGSLHTQSNLNDSMAPSSLMQSQMSNGPSHTPMQQQQQQQQQQSGPSTTSMSSGSSFTHSVPSSSSLQGTALYPPSRTNLNIQNSQVSMMHQQGSGPHYSSSGGQHYQGQQTMSMMGQNNQGNSMVSQRPVGSYRPAQQGSQYMGQEEFYGEQYGHTPSSSEPINQQYYPDVSTHISSLLMESRVMRDPLKSHRNTIMKAETLSIANSRHNISRAQVSSRHSTNSSTNHSQDTAAKDRRMVRDRELHLSTLSISRVRVSSIPHIDPHNLLLALKHRDLILMNRVSMETTSSNESPPS